MAVRRFGATERWLHWVHAVAFTAMLATGLVLYLPMLSRIFADRPLVKDVHLILAIAWVVALALIVLCGRRPELRRTRIEFERFDADDVAFLRRRPSRPARFNGGQKLHAAVQAGLFVLAYVSGALLWLGERNTAFRLDGTIAVHDFVTLLGLVLLIGHAYKTWATPGSLRGMTAGTVSAAYAREHHPRWRP